MTVSDASVTVTCDEDECDAAEVIELTPIAGRGYDLRGVAGRLRGLGWVRHGDRDICATCRREPRRG